MDIEDESYNYWVSRLSSRSPLTVKSYVSHLRQFCKWTSKSPNQLIEERTRLRQAKQWQQADEIRAELARQGVILEDTPEGTTAIWKRKR